MARDRKPRGRMTRWFERVALGAIMGMVAFVVERRLIKVLRRRSQDESRSGTEEDVELTVTPEQVEE